MSHVFQRFGRSHHLRISGADDLRRAVDLDEAHWVATGAPVAAFAADPVFLAALDRDADGRIRAEDVKAAIAWLLATLPAAVPGATVLQLDDVDASGEEGQRIRLAAGKLDLADSDGRVTLEEVRAERERQEAQGLSEAGLVLASAAPDDEVRELVEDIVATVGAAPHPRGEPAVSRETLDAFYEQLGRYLDWIDREVAPLGADTAAA